MLITVDSYYLFTVYFLKQTWALGVSSFGVLIFEFLADNSAWINQSGNPFSVCTAEVSTDQGILLTISARKLFSLKTVV